MENVHSITSPVSGVTFYLWQMTGTEELGRPFRYEIEMVSETGDVDPDKALGKLLVLTVKAEGLPDRHFSGFVSRFEKRPKVGPWYVYRVIIRPWFWFLSHSYDCRIFQQQSVIDIIKKVFNTKHGFSDYTPPTGTYKARDYCVQYRESDFDFISRLMEEEGIYYFFDHQTTKCNMVMVDSPSGHKAVEGPSPNVRYDSAGEAFGENEHLSVWHPYRELQSTKYTTRDYDFEAPSNQLEAKSEVSQTHALAKFERYEYPGNFKVAADGTSIANIRVHEYQADYGIFHGKGSSQRLAVGKKFSLTEHPLSAQNAEYVVMSTETTLQSGEITAFAAGVANRFDVKLNAFASSVAYRPHRKTPKPLIAGPQTAVVVGKQGEEIWTDQYGRVKVQFPWDREGKNDENSSCWIRVAQVWAGKNWGGIHIPRIGQEVLVEFLEGDPDRPVVTGRVYNATQKVPYALPANATQSGIKTHSSKEGTDEHFNELRFEDKKDSEEIYFHAEKDFNRVVENNDTLKVGSSTKDKTDGDQTIDIFNNRSIKIGSGQSKAKDGSETVEIWKNRTTTIKEGNDTLTIEKGNRTETIKAGNDSLTISQGNLTIKLDAGTCKIQAATAIELIVGGSSVKIEPAAITIKTATLSASADGTAELKSPATTVSGDGNLTLKGGIVKTN